MLVLSPLLALVLSSPAHALTCEDVLSLVENEVPKAVLVNVVKEASVLPTDLALCLSRHGLPAEVVEAAGRSGGDDLSVQPEGRAPDHALPLPTVAGASADRWETELARAEDLRRSRRPLAASARMADLLALDPPEAVARDAHWELAQSLADLGLHESARLELRSVLRGGGSDPVGRAALRALLAPSDHDPAAQLLVLASWLPTTVGDTGGGVQSGALHYTRALQQLDAGDLADARVSLQLVEGSLTGRAQGLLASVAGMQGDARGSAQALGQAHRLATVSGDRALLDQTAVAAGRLTYGAGLWEQSADHYARVLPEAALWPDAREEQAWAFYRSGQTDRALGNAVALSSPLGRTVPTPEVHLIVGIARLEACRFDEAARTANQLSDELRGAVASIDAWLGIATPATAFADAVAGGGVGGDEADAIPLPVWRVVMRDRTLAVHGERVSRLSAEMEAVAAQKSVWVDALGTDLIRRLEAEKVRSEQVAGARVLRSMARQRNHLSDVLAQADVLAFEAVDGQRRMLESLSRQPEPATLSGPSDIDFAVATDFVYWPFNGEFWADELDSYRVEMPSRCGEWAAVRPAAGAPTSVLAFRM